MMKIFSRKTSYSTRELLYAFKDNKGTFLRTVRNRVEMLPYKLVAEIFGMEGLEFVGHGGALHEEHAAAHLERVGNTRKGLFHKFKGAADDPVYGDGHAAARHLVTEHIDSLETHFFDNHVEEVDAVRARFAERQADGRIHDLERNPRKTGTAADIDHASRPLRHVGINQRAVGVVAFHHRLESVQASQILVVVVRTQQLVEFPNLLERFGLQFYAVVMQQLVEARKRGRDALTVKQRKVGTGCLEVRHEIATCSGRIAGGLPGTSVSKRLPLRPVARLRGFP